VNVLVDDHEVDLFWPGHRLVVELDSQAFHTSPRAFERDRRKSAELEARGYSVLRFTWAQVTGEPDWVAGCIRAVLDRAADTRAAA
jgi:very-short-patch-repair endonuclease